MNVRAKDNETTAIHQQSENLKMQAQQQEELARLFQAHMSLNQQLKPPTPPPEQDSCLGQPLQQHTQVQDLARVASPIVYSSTHYTHSSHVAQSPSTAPARTHIDAADLQNIFLNNSIDPSLLFPSQVDLFQNADDSQRLRLLELWRISLPSGRPGSPLSPDDIQYNVAQQLYDWPPTSLAQEEAMAKLRYEHIMAEKTQSEHILGHEEELAHSMSPKSESAAVKETRVFLASNSENAEPYMASGYDMLAKREYEASAEAALRESQRYNQATDPVYNSPGKDMGNIMEMENRYGAFAHARDYDVQPVHADDEMVM